LLNDAAEVDVAMSSRSDTACIRDNASGSGAMVEARVAADDLISDCWTSIERVADMLLARGRLSGDEIADLAGLAGCSR
jgi:hypothetical protein